MHGAAENEENGTAVDGQAGKCGPQAEPSEAADEEALVAEDVAESACDEDKGADGEGVARGEPAQLAGLVLDAQRVGNDVLGHNAQGETALSKELGGADDRDEKGFAGEGLGTFNVGLNELELVALEVVAVGFFGDAVVITIVHYVGLVVV